MIRKVTADFGSRIMKYLVKPGMPLVYTHKGIEEEIHCTVLEVEQETELMWSMTLEISEESRAAMEAHEKENPYTWKSAEQIKKFMETGEWS